MADKKDSKKDELKKAEYPLNSLGMGYRSTLENVPYLFTEVDYMPPEENHRFQFCGACPFFRSDGFCVALQGDVHILGSCKLYLSMEQELALRHEAFMRRYFSLQDSGGEAVGKEDLEIHQEIEKVIEERDGKFCVISHQTGKNFGCFDTKFKKEIIVKISSVEEEKRIVYGEVLVPDEVDSQDDTISAEEIEKAAHNYALTPMIVGQGHMKEAKARPVETFIYSPEIMKNVKPGSWVMAVKVDDEELWEGVKRGEFSGFSIGARAKRIELEDK
jgi:hypothetical protein